MPSPQLIYLIALVVLFVAWAAMMFRMLWTISRRASAMNRPGDGFSVQTNNWMRAFFGFFRDPANRRFLIWPGALTAGLMALNIVGTALLAPT